MKINRLIKYCFVLLLVFAADCAKAQQSDSYVQCEDTCRHIHGIDLSHYQGEVFWEAVGDNSKMAYVYLKATEGSSRIDPTYKKNIELAHRYGLKVALTISSDLRQTWCNRWKISSRNADLATRISCR